MNYLRGNDTQPGTYTLLQSDGYPNLGGMMDWSINWDKVTTCNATAYEYATNFENLFPTLSVFENQMDVISIAPNPVEDVLFVNGFNDHDYTIANLLGQTVKVGKIESDPIDVGGLESGLYFFKSDKKAIKFVKQ